MAAMEVLAYTISIILMILLAIFLIPYTAVFFQVFLGRPVWGASWLPIVNFVLYLIFFILSVILFASIVTIRSGRGEVEKKLEECGAEEKKKKEAAIEEEKRKKIVNELLKNKDFVDEFKKQQASSTTSRYRRD